MYGYFTFVELRVHEPDEVLHALHQLLALGYATAVVIELITEHIGDHGEEIGLHSHGLSLLFETPQARGPLRFRQLTVDEQRTELQAGNPILKLELRSYPLGIEPEVIVGVQETRQYLGVRGMRANERVGHHPDGRRSGLARGLGNRGILRQACLLLHTPLSPVRVVEVATDDPTADPVEACMALGAEHGIAAIRAEDDHAASRAVLGVVCDGLDGCQSVRIAGVLLLLVGRASLPAANAVSRLADGAASERASNVRDVPGALGLRALKPSGCGYAAGIAFIDPLLDVEPGTALSDLLSVFAGDVHGKLRLEKVHVLGGVCNALLHGKTAPQVLVVALQHRVRVLSLFDLLFVEIHRLLPLGLVFVCAVVIHSGGHEAFL